MTIMRLNLLLPLSLAALALQAAPLHAQPADPEAGILEQYEQQARGWLGIAFDAQSAGREGLRVAAVHPGSPAQRGGLAVGDVVVRFNNAALDEAALRALRLEPGDTARLRVRREGQRDRELSLVAARRPEQVAGIYRTTPGEIVVFGTGGEGRSYIRVPLDSLRARFDTLAVHADSLHRRMRIVFADSLGPQFRQLERALGSNVRSQALIDSLTRNARVMATTIESDLGARAVAGAEFSELSPALAEYFRGATQGLLVLRVSPNTPAGRAGLEPGDVVTRVNGTSVRTVRELRAAVAGSRDRQISLDVVRKGRAQNVAMTWDR
jgi:S1-C subfamily serine protease